MSEKQGNISILYKCTDDMIEYELLSQSDCNICIRTPGPVFQKVDNTIHRINH